MAIDYKGVNIKFVTNLKIKTMTFVKVKPVRNYTRPTFNKVFDEFFNDAYHTPRSAVRNKPAINIIEAADNFRIEVAAPGLEKGDFAINVEKDQLSISTSREAKLADGDTIKRKEFDYFNFKKSFQLPDSIDSLNIEASYNNGILIVSLPKKEEAKEQPPRKIEIA